MIRSNLILDIFDLTFDEYLFEDMLRRQIAFLSEGHREHTTVGVFIYFETKLGIEQYKTPTNPSENLDINGNPIDRINGVELINKQLNIQADAIVHLKNGIIECLEIWNKNGEDYPITDPVKYMLHQIWNGKSEKRKIVRQ